MRTVFLRSRIVEIRRRKDALYAERAEQANREVQIRLLPFFRFALADTSSSVMNNAQAKLVFSPFAPLNLENALI